MQIYNELAASLEAWIDAKAEARAGAVLDGSCKSFEQYRERCGYIAALNDIKTVIQEWQRQHNGDF